MFNKPYITQNNRINKIKTEVGQTQNLSVKRNIFIYCQTEPKSNYITYF